MVFGDRLVPAQAHTAADWIEPACTGAPGTAGSLVPSTYDSIIRLFPPEPVHEDWWSLYRDLFVAVAAIGARHTSSPDRSWFAIWEGHGYRQVPELTVIPRISLPDRYHYLLVGELSAMAEVRYPGKDGWRNPDLFWPEDRRWFAATDVDIWSLYVGGDDAFVTDLARSLTTPTELIDRNTEVQLEL